MPDIFDALSRDWRAAEDRMHHGAPQPAAQPQPPQGNQPQEETMSFINDAEAHAKAALDVLGQVDHAALDTLERVQANPATAEIFAIIGQLTHLPPESLATAANVLKMTLRLLGGQQPQPAQ